MTVGPIGFQLLIRQAHRCYHDLDLRPNDLNNGYLLDMTNLPAK